MTINKNTQVNCSAVLLSELKREEIGKQLRRFCEIFLVPKCQSPI